MNDSKFFDETDWFTQSMIYVKRGEMFSVIPEKKKNIKNTERQTSGRLTTGNQRKKLILAVSSGELNRKAAILIFCYMYYIPLSKLRHFSENHAWFLSVNFCYNLSNSQKNKNDKKHYRRFDDRRQMIRKTY